VNAARLSANSRNHWYNAAAVTPNDDDLLFSNPPSRGANVVYNRNVRVMHGTLCRQTPLICRPLNLALFNYFYHDFTPPSPESLQLEQDLDPFSCFYILIIETD